MTPIPFEQAVETLPAETQAKWQQLVTTLRALGAAGVAFSGGVDSGLLAATAYYALGDRMTAYTVHSPVDPPGEIESAQALAQQVGFRHEVLAYNDLLNPNFVANPPDRCYHCKLARFRALQALDTNILLEGSNSDDGHDYRPGRRAVLELGARSPLAEVGLTKAEIRALARAFGLVVWDRPSAPCLATRFPYQTPITAEKLAQVGAAEAYLHELGFGTLRVRHYDEVARLELSPQDFPLLLQQRENILARLRTLGYRTITLDLAGYRSGSMNEGWI
jgi:uncharacterized protein